MTWVQTRSGVAFDLLEPRAEHVVLADIIDQLSKLGRFSGATMNIMPYTVAQHSLVVAELLELWGWPPAVVREGLLHDAPEVYYGDITAPVQQALRSLSQHIVDGKIFISPSPLAMLKARVDSVVRAALQLPTEESAIVKRADLVALAIEQRDLMGPCSRDWQLPERADTRVRIREVLYPLDAAQRFRAKLGELDAAIGDAA